MLSGCFHNVLENEEQRFACVQKKTTGRLLLFLGKRSFSEDFVSPSQLDVQFIII